MCIFSDSSLLRNYSILLVSGTFQGVTRWEKNPVAELWKLKRFGKKEASHGISWTGTRNVKMSLGQEEDWFPRFPGSQGNALEMIKRAMKLEKSSGTDYRKFGNKNLLKVFEQSTLLAFSLFLQPSQLCLNLIFCPIARYFLFRTSLLAFCHASSGWTLLG